jgi:drug/metabolite transporter (DMT)-like permease
MRPVVKNPVIYALITAVLFGSGAPLAKTLLSGSSPLFLSSFLYLGSGFGLLLFLLVGGLSGNHRTEREASLTRGDLPWLTGVTLFGGFLAPVTFLVSLAYTHAATASLLMDFEAVTTTVIAWKLFREDIGRRVWVALALITTACILLTLNPTALLGFSLSAMGILAATFFWSLDNNCARNIAAKDPLVIITLKGLVGGTLSLAAAVLLAESLPGFTSVAGGMILGFVSYGGLTSVFFILALRGIGTARSASFLAIAPLFGVPISFLLFTELPPPFFFLAAPVMALGVWLLVTEHHTHVHYHPAETHEHRHRHDDGHHEHPHPPQTPPLRNGEHSHLHTHEAITHDHPHRPDIHHRHLSDEKENDIPNG